MESHRAAVVELAGQPTADLDRLQPAPEGPREHPLDERFQAALEPVQSHGAESNEGLRQRRVTFESGRKSDC